MNFQSLVDAMTTAACVVSVEIKDDDNYGKVRLITGNRAYIDTIERPFENVQMLSSKFVPGSEYTDYMTRDLNFEDSCYRAAVKKKLIHAYAHPARFDVWFNMSFIPLESDDDNIGYCIYMVEINFKPDAKRLSTISADIASAVLETCIKLRSPDNFRSIMKTICEDIRELCDSEHCCVLLMDNEKRSCSVLCEALSKDTKLLSMENYVDDAFYDIAASWKDTIAGSNCLVVRNEHDLEIVKERNPVWHESITSAGGRRIILFPLEFKNELLGYIWAINFSDEAADTIKETLELTTFILSSELYSFRLVERLHVLSSTDMLTGVMNRNEMNNYVDDLAKGSSAENVAVLFADLNGLKVVNDNEGHIAGDNLLRSAAAALQEVFPVNSIFRAGGDEFVVILLDVAEERFNEMADKLREAESHYDRLVFAIGKAYDTDISNIHHILRLADERMYEDKNLYYKAHPEKKRINISKQA